MEKEIKQVAGASITEFVVQLSESIEDGWKLDTDSAVHFWPSTFYANVYKEKETKDTQTQDVQVQDKKETQQRQQRKTKP